jgi:hypothetical protein
LENKIRILKYKFKKRKVMFWFLFVVVLLFIGFIYNALEYLQEMFEELSNPSTKSKGIGKLLSVIIVFVGLLIIFL